MRAHKIFLVTIVTTFTSFILPSPLGAETLDTATGKRLLSEELASQFSGNTAQGSTAKGLKWEVRYKKDGTMMLKHRYGSDSGTWSVEDGKLCEKWKNSREAKRICFVIKQEGDVFKSFAPDGQLSSRFKM